MRAKEDEQFENEDEENAETQREEEEDLGLTGEEDEASNAAGVEYSATSGHDWEAAASDMDAAQNGEGGVDSSDPTVTEETDGEEVSPGKCGRCGSGNREAGRGRSGPDGHSSGKCGNSDRGALGGADGGDAGPRRTADRGGQRFCFIRFGKRCLL